MMTPFENLDPLRNTCPPGTHWVGPTAPDGFQISVNSRVEAACLRPEGNAPRSVHDVV